jgi:hypothetical protein
MHHCRAPLDNFNEDERWVTLAICGVVFVIIARSNTWSSLSRGAFLFRRSQR